MSEFEFVMVYLDADEEPFYYVRIVGGDPDLFSHGIGLANKFSNEDEANEYAKRVDEYLKTIFEVCED